MMIGILLQINKRYLANLSQIIVLLLVVEECKILISKRFNLSAALNFLSRFHGGQIFIYGKFTTSAILNIIDGYSIRQFY